MQKYRVAFRQVYYQDLETALEYYGNITESLDDDFEKDVDAAIDSLGTFCSYEVKIYGLRNFNLRQFQYTLHFFVNDHRNLVEIVALLRGHAEFPVERLKGNI